MLSKASDFYTYTVVLTDTAFAFFPALISWSAFRVFGGKPSYWFLATWFDGGSWSGYKAL